MLDVGKKAPKFTLQDDQGNDVTLDSLLEKGPLILYFYPADFTPGCTKEACSIRDIHDDLSAVGLTVAGVSPQGQESHARFRAQHGLPFILLSDPEKKVIRKYDVDGLFGVGVRRATFLINEKGKIEDAVQADILVDRHREFIENAIALRESSV